MITKRQKEAAKIVNKLLNSNMFTQEELAARIDISISQFKKRLKDERWRNTTIDNIVELNLYCD